MRYSFSPFRQVDSCLANDPAFETYLNKYPVIYNPQKIAEYVGDLLLVGISYDRETKTHTCKIEHYQKLLT